YPPLMSTHRAEHTLLTLAPPFGKTHDDGPISGECSVLDWVEAERDHPCAQPLTQPPHPGILARQHRPILGPLFAEQRSLRLAIFVERAVAIEMVVGEIEKNADRRPQLLDPFELEARHLGDRAVDRQ